MHRAPGLYIVIKHKIKWYLEDCKIDDDGARTVMKQDLIYAHTILDSTRSARSARTNSITRDVAAESTAAEPLLLETQGALHS